MKTEITNMVKNADGTVTYTETVTELSSTKVRTVTATEWEVTHHNCFCCTCSDLKWDPHCRNHGVDGVRPCTEHNTEGKPDEQGNIPHSVQKEIQLQIESHRRSHA